MPSIPFDDLAVLEPRLGKVASLLENIRDKKSITFSAECDRVIFEHLSDLLKQATQ